MSDFSGRNLPRSLGVDLLSFLASLGRHMGFLGALVGEEVREAGVLGLRLAIAFALALFFAGFGYVLFLIAVVFCISTLFHISWMIVLSGFSLLHMVLALLCVNYVRIHWRTPLFTATQEEIARDLDMLGRGGQS